jgi:hypothetical protein
MSDKMIIRGLLKSGDKFEKSIDVDCRDLDVCIARKNFAFVFFITSFVVAARTTTGVIREGWIGATGEPC